MSSKRRQRRRSCENKVRHLDEAAAAAHATSLRSAWYRCSFCGAWHVGRRSRQLKAAIRARRERKTP